MKLVRPAPLPVVVATLLAILVLVDGLGFLSFRGITNPTVEEVPQIGLESVNYTPNGNGTVSVAAQIGADSLGGTVSAVVGADETIPASVLIYYDPVYPMVSASVGFASSLQFLIPQSAVQRGVPVPTATVISATLLENVLKDPIRKPGSTVLVLGTGVLPALVFNNTTNLITPWIESGGIVAWAGLAPGWVEAGPNQTLSQAVSSSLQWEGQLQLLGYPLVNPASPAANGQQPNESSPASAFAEAMDIPSLLSSSPISTANVTSVQSAGGSVLGHYTGGTSNQTDLVFQPMGEGGFLYLSAGLQSFLQQTEFTWVLMQTLFTGVAPTQKFIASASFVSPSLGEASADLVFTSPVAANYTLFAFLEPTISAILYRLAFVFATFPLNVE